MVPIPGLPMIQTTGSAPMPSVVSQPLQEVKQKDDGVFAELFGQLIGDVNQMQLQANQIGESFILGKHQDVAALVLATQKADLALDLTIQVRNKLVEAYQEVMRMQV